MLLPFDEAALFGYAARCHTFQDVLKLLSDVVEEDARSAVAAYGMLLVAKLAKRGPYRQDTLELLNQMARAKAELDITVCHIRPVVEVTSQVLLAAQRFADQNTIPCTEWPSVEEVTAMVFEESKKFAKIGIWKLVKRNEKGVVVGCYTVDDQG